MKMSPTDNLIKISSLNVFVVLLLFMFSLVKTLDVVQAACVCSIVKFSSESNVFNLQF